MRALLAGALVLLVTPPASGQDPWVGRARLSLSVGLAPEGKGFSQESTLVEYVEPAPVTASLDQGSAPLFDVGLAFPLAGRVGLSVAFSGLSASGAAAVNAGIPHPFLFDAHRPVTGEVDVERMEMALHGGLAYLVGGGPVDVIVSGGGSWFRVRQDLVTDVEFDEAYPYDTARFVSATLAEATGSKIGYHAGADVTWRLSPVWGIGALVRYSRAEVPLVAGDVEAAPMKVGGIHAAAGLRLIFP